MQVLAELGHHLARLEPPAFRPDLLQQHRGDLEQREVVLDHALDARAQHLDGDLGAIGQAGEMHLRHRGRSHWRALEVVEDGVDRLAVEAFQHRQRLLGGEGRHAVLEQGELVGEVGRQQVAPGRQHLAELDEDRPERLERLAQARAARFRKRAPEEDLVPDVRQPAAAVGVEHHAVEAEAQADGDDLGEAEEAHGGRPDEAKRGL